MAVQSAQHLARGALRRVSRPLEMKLGPRPCSGIDAPSSHTWAGTRHGCLDPPGWLSRSGGSRWHPRPRKRHRDVRPKARVHKHVRGTIYIYIFTPGLHAPMHSFAVRRFLTQISADQALWHAFPPGVGRWASLRAPKKLGRQHPQSNSYD